MYCISIYVINTLNILIYAVILTPKHVDHYELTTYLINYNRNNDHI